MSATLREIQRVVGEVLIPEARAEQCDLPGMDHSLPIAMELFYVALSMKPGYQAAGTCVARRYAERMGLDGDAVQAYAVQKIAAALEAP